ncbi:MAG: primosomal protein DnaI [Aerococcus sp.]|nr:primosomal protein DnaI [Aerococcus sp.]
MRNIGQDITHELNKSNYRERLQQMKEEVLRDSDVRAFLHQHESELTSNAIDRSLSKLYEYVQEKHRIETHQTPKFPNYYPRLIVNVNYIDIEYVPTEEYLAKQAERERLERVSLVQLPKDLHHATFDQFDQSDPARQNALEAAVDFAEQVIANPGKFVQAPYFYGPFGVGKTYLLGAIANAFAEHDIESVLIHYPTFVTSLKQSINDNTVQDRIDELLEAQILVIDDIGAEKNTAWERDEVLGVVLQGRMSEGRPTLFSSNFDMDDLEDHFAHSDHGQSHEPVKAGRIMERIRTLAREVEMGGRNRRYQ